MDKIKFKWQQSQKFYGVGVLLIAIYVLFSLLSYSADDISLNVSNTTAEIHNLGGKIGAIIADFMLQLCGLGAWVMVIVLFWWSLILLALNHLSYLWLRIPCMMLSGISFAVVLGAFKKYNYSMQMLPGGYIGLFLYDYFLHFISGKIIILMAFLLFILFFYFSISIINKTYLQKMNLIVTLCKRLGDDIVKIFDILWMIISLKFIVYLFTDYRKIIIVIKELFARQPNKNIITVARKENKNINMPEENELTTPSYKMLPLKGDKAINFDSTNLPTKTAEKTPTNVYTPPRMDLLFPEPNIKHKENKDINLIKTEKLLGVLKDFGIKGEIVNCYQGPVVTLFELQPEPGTKSSRVVGLASDIARAMEVTSARVSVVSGRNAIGIELPNDIRQTVYLKSIFETDLYVSTKAEIPLVLGRNISGGAVISDLTKMPHLLIAGTTGSGKSVGVNCMIMSILYKLSPENCKFIMIDPKMLEFSLYDGIPHLLSPVITDPKKAILALKWAAEEMERRYQLMSNIGVRNIIGYNDKVLIAKARNGKIVRELEIGYNPETGDIEKKKLFFEAELMSYIVIIIDEVADLMLVAGKELEMLIQRLSQMARAAGIHLIMATQRPSVDVITGVIKANFPNRISYQVTSKIDSRTILGEQGAEQLLGHGDMLFMSSGGKIERIHGPYVSDQEVENIVTYLKSNYKKNYIDITAIKGEEEETFEGGTDRNYTSEEELYKQAVDIVLKEKKCTISYLQRRLRIGYNKAANYVEKMEAEGLVSKPDAAGKRIILADE